jgi:hypothetical protein
MSEMMVSDLLTTYADISYLIASYEKGEDGGGVILKFHNNYELSVSWRPGAYGGLEGAVMHPDEKGKFGSPIVYDTPITYDVVGWLNKESLKKLIRVVAALPVRTYTEATGFYEEVCRHGWDEDGAATHRLEGLGAVEVEAPEEGYRMWRFEDGSEIVLDDCEFFESPRLRMK